MNKIQKALAAGIIAAILIGILGYVSYKFYIYFSVENYKGCVLMYIPPVLIQVFLKSS